MPIDPDALSLLAHEYTKAMTSIRGRRVQRLLKREFAGAEHVLIAQASSGAAVVLGVSQEGAALCATDGTGKQASVVKWRHESTAAVETQFDLHKDSLPVRGTNTLSFSELRKQAPLAVPADRVPPGAGPLVAQAVRVLA